MPRNGDSRRAAGCAFQRRRFYAAWQRYSLRIDSDQERWTQRNRFNSGRTEGISGAEENLCFFLVVLREGRSAADEQARDRIADQSRCARFIWAPRAVDCGGGQGNRTGTEDAARHGGRTARTLRNLRRSSRDGSEGRRTAEYSGLGRIPASAVGEGSARLLRLRSSSGQVCGEAAQSSRRD